MCQNTGKVHSAFSMLPVRGAIVSIRISKDSFLFQVKLSWLANILNRILLRKFKLVKLLTCLELAT